MRVPWTWLKEYVDLDWTVEETCERLTHAGVKVENLVYEKLDLSGVVSALVEDVSTHPARPDLKVGTVNTGEGRYTVVSGAPGFEKGNLVLLAVPSSRLPGGITIETRSVAGVESQGMVVCSNEILAGEEPRPGEDIILLPPGTPLGIPAQELFTLDDWVIELDLTVNFSHCLSIMGVAIEASALSGKPLKLPEVYRNWDWAGPYGSRRPADDPDVEGEWKVELPDPDLCPRYVGKVVREVRTAYAPIEVERRLMLAGMRPISAIVDATNYVMLECGQPLHAFDADRLEGKTIWARRARQGETIETLDGEERRLEEGMLVIADARGPVAVAGVMGGSRTEVSAGTRNVLLESAFFAPIPTRQTYRKLRLRTEASARFEKTVDPTAQPVAIERAAELIAKYTGGVPERGRTDANLMEPLKRSIPFSMRVVKRTLGAPIPIEKCKEIFESLHFAVGPVKKEGDFETMDVTVPPRRVDIKEEIDLCEEVARIYGYDKFEAKPLTPAVPGGPPNKEYVWFEKMKDFLVSMGGREVVTTSLLSPDDLLAMGWDESDGRSKGVPLMDPLSSSESVLRTSLLPGLLKVVQRNQSVRMPGGFFWETGRVFFPSREELPLEAVQLGLCMYGTLRESTWVEGEAEATFFRLKGVVETLLRLMGIEASFLPGASMPMHPGISARVVAGHSTVGEVGELHPLVKKNLGLIGNCVLAWFSVEAILAMAKEKRFTPVSKFMPVERDIAVVVDASVPADSVVKVVKETARDLRSVTVFDVYDKPPVPEGKKSIALRLTYNPSDRTLTEEELSEDRERIVKALREAVGGEIRL
ncbi:MAG TPA: phenylalanine--tRNA ligase subunit beta [Firmicutes bacterium]|nr:phenylalanine--tRNA ligase subunit beta [Candidatus Fermentithermobacillaceae bacterium]